MEIKLGYTYDIVGKVKHAGRKCIVLEFDDKDKDTVKVIFPDTRRYGKFKVENLQEVVKEVVEEIVVVPTLHDERMKIIREHDAEWSRKVLQQISELFEEDESFNKVFLGTVDNVRDWD